MQIDGPLLVPKGWGAFNETTGQFYYLGNSPMIGSNEDKIFEKIVDNNLVDSHVPMVYYAIVQLTIEVNTGAENGDGGLLEMVATSVSNAANRSGKVTFSLSVETVLGAELILDGDVEREITLGEIGNSPRFEVEVFNSGNVESEFKIFTSSGMRGWSIVLSYESGSGCERNGDHILCTIAEGESVLLLLKLTLQGHKVLQKLRIRSSLHFLLSQQRLDWSIERTLN